MDEFEEESALALGASLFKNILIIVQKSIGT
jgi:hypothetical protein